MQKNHFQGKYYQHKLSKLKSVAWLLVLMTIFFMSACKRHYDATSDISALTIDYAHEKTKNEDENNEVRKLTGKVVGISDGDTFTLLLENELDLKIRLDGIDCPENKQAYSRKAKQALSDLIFNNLVRVEYNKKDGFGRILGTTFINDINVNQEMVRLGYAWHFKKYSDDPVLAKLEVEARKNRKGLWVEANPIPPWEYRKR